MRKYTYLCKLQEGLVIPKFTEKKHQMKYALITGASRGIGRAIAFKLAKQGYAVVINYLHNDAAAQQTRDKIVAEGGKAELLRFDVAQPDAIEQAVEQWQQRHPDDYIDVLVNNAGIQEGERVIDVNLKGTVAVTEKYAFHDNIKSVVFMASSSASSGSEFPLYAASKGGVVSYMKNTALRLAKYSAACNSISAGGVLTELNEHIISDPELMRACLDETLLNKWASAEEIAELCFFLTNINKSMTGQDILVDNGEQLKSNFIW